MSVTNIQKCHFYPWLRHEADDKLSSPPTPKKVDTLRYRRRDRLGIQLWLMQGIFRGKWVSESPRGHADELYRYMWKDRYLSDTFITADSHSLKGTAPKWMLVMRVNESSAQATSNRMLELMTKIIIIIILVNIEITILFTIITH